MLSFLVRRTAAMAAVLVAISVLVFLIFFATPGIDPARQLAGRNPTPQTIATIRHQFALDKPLPVQYLRMMKQLFVTRDLVSYANRGAKVVPQIFAAAPVTLSLVVGAAVIWVAMSLLMGVLAAVLRGTVWETALMLIALVGVSIPVFWLGEVANLFTQSRWHGSFLFGWVPPLGYVSPATSVSGWFKALVIPWLVLSFYYVGLYARVLRSSVLDTQHLDYVRTARAKGLPESRVLLRHVVRTSLITFVSLFGLDFGVIAAGGALLVEVVFNLHGVGWLTYQSLTTLDLPLIMGAVVYGACFIVVANAVVDVVYALLDPRVRHA